MWQVVSLVLLKCYNKIWIRNKTMSFLLLGSPYLWLSLGLALILLELLLPGVYLFWIGLAALLVALPASLLETSAAYLVLWFVIAMALSVWIGMKVQAQKQSKADTLNQGLEAYVNTVTTVAETEGVPLNTVRIHLAGTTYLASGPQNLQVGDTVQITSVKDGRFFIQKVADSIDEKL